MKKPRKNKKSIFWLPYFGPYRPRFGPYDFPIISDGTQRGLVSGGLRRILLLPNSVGTRTNWLDLSALDLMVFAFMEKSQSSQILHLRFGETRTALIYKEKRKYTIGFRTCWIASFWILTFWGRRVTGNHRYRCNCILICFNMWSKY